MEGLHGTTVIKVLPPPERPQSGPSGHVTTVTLSRVAYDAAKWGGTADKIIRPLEDRDVFKGFF